MPWRNELKLADLPAVSVTLFRGAANKRAAQMSRAQRGFHRLGLFFAAAIVIGFGLAFLNDAWEDYKRTSELLCAQPKIAALAPNWQAGKAPDHHELRHIGCSDWGTATTKEIQEAKLDRAYFYSLILNKIALPLLLVVILAAAVYGFFYAIGWVLAGFSKSTT